MGDKIAHWFMPLDMRYFHWHDARVAPGGLRAALAEPSSTPV